MIANLRELLFSGSWFDVLHVVVLSFGGLLSELSAKKIWYKLIFDYLFNSLHVFNEIPLSACLSLKKIFKQ